VEDLKKKSVHPAPVEACPERLPQAASRRGLPFFAPLIKKKDKASTSSAQAVFT
jgi:hypothetical protein